MDPQKKRSEQLKLIIYSSLGALLLLILFVFFSDKPLQTANHGWRFLASHSPHSYDQSAYRLFKNANSTTPGSTYAAQDTSADIGSQGGGVFDKGGAFRLRMLLHNSGALDTGAGHAYKLQFAEKSGTCDTGFSGESYADVTSSTVIAFNDNSSVADGALPAATGSDPTHSSHTVVLQTYEEANNFTVTSAIADSIYDGLWDFSLRDLGAKPATSYCFRAVNSDGTTLNAYNVIPEILTGTIYYTQGTFRWFANNNSTDVGSPLAASSVAATAPAQGTPFRLRYHTAPSSADLLAGGQNFKLQFAERSGTCDNSFSGESYSDVSPSSGVIRFYDNSAVADDAASTSNANDPTNGSLTKENQSYNESNNFTNLTNLAASGDTGLWDFALVDNSAPASTAYCFRTILADGTLLTSYPSGNIPQITTAVSNDTISGTVYTDEGTTNIGSSKIVRLAINGADNSTTTTNASGAYSFTGLSTSAGDVITVYLEDETQDAVTVTVTTGGDLSSIDLYQNRLIVRHDNSGSLTNANLSTAAVSGETDISNIYSVGGSELAVASGKELFILSGHTFAPGGVVNFDDIDINGAFTMAANTVTATGTWDAASGSFSSSGTVTFRATTSETIISDGDSFNNVTFNGVGGTWTLEDAFDVNGNLTITNGTLDTKSSENNSINIAGNYTNNSALTENNSTTTFDGSSAQAISGSDLTFYNLTINNSAASPSDSTDVDPDAAVTVTNTLTVTDGQFSPPSSSDFAAVSIGANGILKPDSTASITVSGNWSNSGTFTHNSGTTTFDGLSQTFSGANTFNNFRKIESANDATDEVLTFTANSTTTIAGTWTLDGRDANDRINILSTTPGTTQWKVDPQGTRALDFIDVADSNNINAAAVNCAAAECTDAVNSGNNTNWTFSGGDVTAPTVSSLSPADNSTGIAITTDLVITFSETVAAGSGDVSIVRTNPDGSFTTTTIPVGSTAISGSQVTINTPQNLLEGHPYHIKISAGGYKDASDNNFAGINNETTWNFTTTISSGPVVQAKPKISLVEYQWFDHFGADQSGRAVVGPVLTKKQSQPAIIPNTPFRLRLILHIANSAIGATDNKIFKLQYAKKSGVCDSEFDGENYQDIGGAVQFWNPADSQPADGASLAPVDAPDHSHPKSYQGYERRNPFLVYSSIPQGWDAIWDFALIGERDNYCFRVVNGDDTPLDSYEAIPELALDRSTVLRRGQGLVEKPVEEARIKTAFKRTLDEFNAKKIAEGALNLFNIFQLGDDSDIAILPRINQNNKKVSFGVLGSNDNEKRWDIAGDLVETNSLIVNDQAIFEGDAWFRGSEGSSVFIFGKESVVINAANNRLSFGRNPESGIVFGEGENSSFSFYDANNLNDLAGRKKLFSVIDKGESANIEVTGGADFNVDGTSESFRIRSVNNPDFFLIDPAAEKITISGRLDIGRTIIANSADSRGMAFFRYDDNGSLAPFISFRRHRGTFDVPASVQAGDFLGKFDFQGYDGLARQQSAIFAAVVDGPVTPGNVPTAFIISTGANGGNSPERLRVTSAGFVGINTSTPSHTLTVQGDLLVTGSIICDDPQCDFASSGGAVDITAPAIQQLTPADNANDVATNANLIIAFSENVNAQTGNIYLHGPAGVLVETISVASARVTGSGTNVITINPSVSFIENIGYYVLIDSGAFADAAGNNFAGISNNSIWNFSVPPITVSDTTPPTPVLPFSPADNSTSTAISSNLITYFNEDITVGSGTILIKRSDLPGEPAIETITVPSANVTASGSSIIINPSADLPYGASIFINISSGAIKDLNNNNYAGITDNFTWNFTIKAAPVSPPVTAFDTATAKGVAFGRTRTEITVNNISGGANSLYIAAVNIFSRHQVSSIGGGGLTWTLVKRQCAGRPGFPMEIWKAFGSPTAPFNVAITTAGTSNDGPRSSAAVTRFANASPNLESVTGSNWEFETFGTLNDTSCDGSLAVETLNPQIRLSPAVSGINSLVYTLSHTRHRFLRSVNPGYNEIARVSNFSGGDGANLLLHTRSLTTASSSIFMKNRLGGSNGNVWGLIGFVINPLAGP